MSLKITSQATSTLSGFTAYHTGHSDDDKGNGEQLSHIEGHSCLEIDLVGLRVFDEEAERENQRENEAKVKTAADFFS